MDSYISKVYLRVSEYNEAALNWNYSPQIQAHIKWSSQVVKLQEKE